MENIITITVRCPACGAKMEITLYNVVNEQERPGVGRLIGSYQAHTTPCPECGVGVITPYATFYEDFDKGILFAFVTSREKVAKVREHFKEAKRQGGKRYENYKLRVFTNLDNYVSAVDEHVDTYCFNEEGYKRFEQFMKDLDSSLGL